MNWRATLGLLVALIVLCGAYVGMQFARVSEVAEQVQKSKIFDFDPEAVTRLSIERIDEVPSVAEREPGGAWDIKEPNDTIAPLQMLWDRVALHFAELMRQRELDLGGLELADYGLDVPVLIFQGSAEGEDYELKFGTLEPTQEYRYALLNGERLLLVHKDQFFELNRPLMDLRNRFTVDDREADILTLEFAVVWTNEEEGPLENPPAVGEESVAVRMERASADDVWRMTSPWEALANQEAVEALVSELQFAVAQEFFDNPESLEDFGLQPPRYRITLVDNAEGRAQTLQLGYLDDESGGLFAKRADRDSVFVMDPQVITLFPKSPGGLQEKRLLTRQALAFDRIDIERPGGRFTLVDTPDQGWQIDGETEFITDQNAVSLFISNLKRARGDRYFPGEPAEFGLDTPELRIVMHPKEEGEPAVILLTPHPEEPGRYYGKQDLGPVFDVPAELVEPLLVDRLFFRSRFLMRFVPATATGVRLAFEGTDYGFQQAHGRWVVTEPEGKTLASQGDIERLLDSLSKFVSVTIHPETDTPDSGYGLDDPILEAAVTIRKEGEDPVTFGPVTVGATTGDQALQRYATLEGRAGVYRVRQKVIDDVREFLRAVQDKAAE